MNLDKLRNLLTPITVSSICGKRVRDIRNPKPQALTPQEAQIIQIQKRRTK